MIRIPSPPPPSYLFWTDRILCVVERSSLDGKNRMLIASNGLVNPTALCLDMTTDDLYWLDSTAVYKSRLDGKSIRKMLTGDYFKQLVGLAIGRVSTWLEQFQSANIT